MKLKPLSVILGIVAVLTVWLWTGYNGLVTSKETVDATWAQVETQYQRRFDLVPNLVSTVKGAANFEQETFTAVTAARSQWQAAAGTGDRAGQIAAAQGFDSALSRLLLTVEAYPQLQATQAYRDLMTQLEGTENRIATARRDFNEVVKTFNISVKRFPGMILAKAFGFTEEAFFQSSDAAAEAPKVDL
ncbi:LemA family protein [Candidatus Peregrinibacteria bacterium]|nr:LemA family protein [Candidatus Peregrinibacteria bacterium]